MDKLKELWEEKPQVIVLPFLGFAAIVAVAVLASLAKDPFKLLGEIEADDRLCPVDASQTAATHVVLLDFSDPLPEEYERRPRGLVDQVIENEVDQFDRVALYAFNPRSIVPEVIGNFCLPVAMSTLSESEQRAMWGRGVREGEKLSDRQEKYRHLFEKLWEHDRRLEEEMLKIDIILQGLGRQSEARSRLIENIEETVARERRAPGLQIKVHILSDMMENSRVYSLYKQPRNFQAYKEKRERAGESDLPDMSDAEFFVDIIPSCGGIYTSKQKRELKEFWSGYFRAANSSVKFLPSKDVDLGRCAGDEPPPPHPDPREPRKTGQEVLVNVPIRSDGTMRVRVEPGEDLGRFVGKRIISVPPGTYRIIGKRRRYEDSIHILTVHSNGEYEIVAAK